MSHNEVEEDNAAKERLMQHIEVILDKSVGSDLTSLSGIVKEIGEEFLAINHNDEIRKIIVPLFKDNCEEFLSIIEPLIDTTSAYYRILENLIDVLCTIYGIKIDVVHIELRNYGNNIWGPVFWKFVHYTAILIEHAYSNTLINDILDYPTIVYNIDQILPCSVCAYNYMKIKDSSKILMHSVKNMSFGKCVEGSSIFHNVITEHIAQQQQHDGAAAAAVAAAVPYTSIDFANEYHFLSHPQEQKNKSKDYIKMNVEFHPLRHRMLCVLLVLWRNISGSRIDYHDANKLMVQLYKEAAAAASTANAAAAATEPSSKPQLMIYQKYVDEFISNFKTTKIDAKTYTILERYIIFVFENMAQLYPTYIKRAFLDKSTVARSE